MLQNAFGCPRLLLAALAWLAAGCATYEATPLEQRPADEEPCGPENTPCAGGGTSPGAGASARAGTSTSSPGGNASQAGRGNASGAGAGADAAGAGAGGSSPEPSAGSAGQPANGGSGASTGGAGNDMGGTQTWSFEQDAEGWAVREQSPELTAGLTSSTGALRLTDVPFSAAKQFVDVAYTFDSPADLRGRTLRATVRRTSGAFVGAQLYVYGGAWASPGFDSLSSGDATELTLTLDTLASTGVTPASISRIGLKLGTGSNTSNTFGPTTIEITEVALE